MWGLILGIVVGSAATYYWRDLVERYVNDAVPGMRDRAARRLGDMGERADRALERARSRIGTTVRAGQQKLRATGTSDPTTIGTARPAGTGTPGPDTAAERTSRIDRPLAPHDRPDSEGRFSGR
jgi:hypothetical protein